MRLIDADALVDDGLRFQDGYDHDGIMMVRLGDVTKSIRNAPTIDAVPVVRCRECYLGRPIKFMDGRDMIACEFDGGITRFPDFYCKAGDRKDGDGDEAD